MAGARLIRASVALLAALALSLLAFGTASAAVPPPYLSSFGPDGSEASDFGEAGSVAVDQQTGAVYVLDLDSDSLLQFETNGTVTTPVNFAGSAPYISGNEITGLSLQESFGKSQIAVDSTSHKIYVTEGEGQSIRAFDATGEPSLFTAGPGLGTNEIGGFTEATGVAVDPSGNIYVGDFADEVVKIFAPTGEEIIQFEATTPGNIAVDSNGAVYVVRFDLINGDVGKFTPSEPVTATTTYTAGSEPFHSASAYTVAVDPTTNDVYVAQTPFAAQGPLIAWHDESGTLLATFAGAGEDGEVRGATGLAVHGVTERVFVANNQFDFTRVEIFGPEEVVEGPPTIQSTAATDVAAASATLHAEINPNTFATTYRFEYGFDDCAVSACTSVPLGGADIGAGHQLVAVSQSIGGLQAATTYHYRVVAENEKGPTPGPDRTFTTQLSGLGFQLADRRAWEMVSPPNKSGKSLVGSFWGLTQAAADGNGLAYLSQGSIEADPEGNRVFEASTVLARRDAAGWRSKDITPPHTRVVPKPVGDLGEYKLFSSDLSGAVFEQRDDAALSPQASERTPYLRQNTEPAAYTPLVTGKEGFANVPPGTEFGGDLKQAFGAVSIAGATSDLSHVVLLSEVPLAPGAVDRALYLWSAGQLGPVSVLPPGEGGAIVQASFVGSGPRSIRHAISDNGGRVLWGTGSSSDEMTALYMRDMAAEETVRLDVVQPGASGLGTARPTFQGASADGTTVFFTDSRQLTEDASTAGADLYRCEVPLGSPLSGCSSLTDLSAPLAGSGENAEVQGVVSALSEDGGTLYFVARGVLDSAANQAGDSAIPDEPNLYRWQEGDGVRFIATLSSEDAPDWGVAGSPGSTGSLSAAGSPGGRYLSFMSERSLTGYDNREVLSGELLQEVFRYDAVADRLDCVSCNPTGATPRGEVIGHPLVPPLVDQRRLWENRALAASLPQATTIREGRSPSLYRPRAMLDNGRVFFNALDSLVAADSNGEWDVYQYEPTGIGDCGPTSGGAAIAQSAGGCVSLISSGTGEAEAAFLDASASGDDVFFLTAARLSVTDEDVELDVYDARVDGLPAKLALNAECLGEACQPTPLAPNDPTPASEAFHGPGNEKVCPKGKRKVKRQGKVRCIPRKPSKHKRRGQRASQERRRGQ